MRHRCPARGILKLLPLFLMSVGSVLTSEIPTASADPLAFSDNFETNQSWSIAEEIVGGSPCYGSGIGEVARSKDVAYDGSYSLRIWANKARSLFSNHVIGHKQISNSGQTARFRYELYAFAAPEADSDGHTGPEFSVQNTREIAPGVFGTSTFAIQHVLNRFDPLFNQWQVWHEYAPGLAAWEPFMVQDLVPGQWYYLAVEADYRTNRYVGFRLRGPGADVFVDLSAYTMAQELKWSEEAFVITLEGENLPNDCGETGPFDYRIYYDKANLGEHYDFLDVTGNFWAWREIEAVFRAGITTGCSHDDAGTPDDPWDDTREYCPADSVTRAQMAVFLVRALGEEPDDPFDPASWPYDPDDPSTWAVSFEDVPSDTDPDTAGAQPYWAWYHIQRLYDLGTTRGCDPTRFCPEDSVRRDQMAVFLVRALGLEPADSADPTGWLADLDPGTECLPCLDVDTQATWCKSFADVPVDTDPGTPGDQPHWAWFHIQTLCKAGVTRGCGDGTEFCPGDVVARDQMAVFLARAFLGF